jgi:hypothetical protein
MQYNLNFLQLIVFHVFKFRKEFSLYPKNCHFELRSFWGTLFRIEIFSYSSVILVFRELKYVFQAFRELKVFQELNCFLHFEN